MNLKHLNLNRTLKITTLNFRMMTAGLVALCFVAAPRMAAAQTMQFTDKGYAGVNFGGQIGSHDLSTNTSFSLYDETATVATKQTVKGGAYFEIGGAYRVYGHNLLAGVTYSHTSSSSNLDLAASIPNPFFFDQPRTVSSTQSGAKHSENTVHIDAIWMMPVANKLDLALFAGPSIFGVKQDTVQTVTVTETSDVAHPSVAAPLVSVSKVSFGGNIGVDVQYLIAKKWGVGGVIRYSFGSATIDGATDKLVVGGFDIGAGVRLRF